jgi:DNA transposition AAA+ family ATPase
MKNCFVRTLNYQRLEELCEELLGPAGGAEMAAVVGRAGRGKTTAGERIVTMNQSCVYALYKEGDSQTDLLREICFALSGARPGIRRRCHELIQDEMSAQRRLVIVDEVDRMPKACLHSLRNIHDLCRVPILMIGEEVLPKRLASEERLVSRTRRNLLFGPVSQPDVAEFYRSAMGQVPDPSELATLTRHSGGSFRRVRMDALSVERILKVSSLKRITADVVREVVKDDGHVDD